jgi:DNA repair protein RecO
MAHHVYQSEALLLRNAPSGDSNRFVDLFTRELGLVRAVAQSARRERSKMRFALQEYSHAHVALVRGRMYWRVTGVQEIQNFYYNGQEEHVRVLVAKVSALLRRLLHGEEKNELLYTAALEFYLYVTRQKIVEGDVAAIESLIVLRILYHLGYIAGYENLLTTNEFTKKLLGEVSSKHNTIVKDINSALQESQL